MHHRFFNVVKKTTSPTSSLRVKTLSHASRLPSISTLVQMNALGDYTLMLTLGTLLETYSFKNLLNKCIKDSMNSEPLYLKLKNIGIEGTKFTLVKLASAIIGYYLFTLMNKPIDLSISVFLSIVGVGSSLFALSVPIITEIIRSITPPLLKGIFCTIVRNASDAEAAIERCPSLRPL